MDMSNKHYFICIYIYIFIYIYIYMIYGKLTMTSPRRHRSDGDYRGNYPQKRYFRLHSIVNDMCIYIYTHRLDSDSDHP